MAYTAKCDTATPSKWWITGTGTGGVNRLAVVLTDNPSGVLIDGSSPATYVAWSTFMTQITANSLYRIHLSLYIGDGSTATTLDIRDGEVVEVEQYLYTNNATVNVGVKSGNRGTRGAILKLKTGLSSAGRYMTTHDSDVWNIYGSMFAVALGNRTWWPSFSRGTIEIIDSRFQQQEGFGTSSSFNTVLLTQTYGTMNITIDNLMVSNCYYCYFAPTTSSVKDFRLNRVRQLVDQRGEATVTLENALFEDMIIDGFLLVPGGVSNGHLSLLNCKTAITATNVSIGTTTATISLQYTVSVHIADKDGNDIEGATVTWVDAQSQTGNDTTDANGDVSFQLMGIKWYGTSIVETDYNPSTFTISKPGYETLTLENITIDAPIDWYLELQPDVKTNVSGGLVQILGPELAISI